VAERWDVKSGHGGSIAVWVEGEGPPLVLVHGSVSDHTVYAPLVGELRDEFTIFAMDRRGFGASQDDPGYSAEREFGDVAAVVNAVAARTGEPVVLFGASWGASCALGAARDLPSLRALVLYEPSLGRRQLPGSLDRMEKRIAAGDYEGALVEMGREVGSQKSRSRNGGRHQIGPSASPPPLRPSESLGSKRTGTGSPKTSPASPSPPCSSPDPRRRPSLQRSHP
jgi:pimeloyl-ACP methyl ester carboxylesterase